MLNHLYDLVFLIMRNLYFIHIRNYYIFSKLHIIIVCRMQSILVFIHKGLYDFVLKLFNYKRSVFLWIFLTY